MAQARSLHAREKFAEALEMLRAAIKAAEQLGDEGYEPLHAEPVMLGYAAASWAASTRRRRRWTRCLEAVRGSTAT